MATVSTVARDKIANDFAAAFDRMEIRTSGGGSVLATITLNWGASSTGVITADPASVNATAGGTAAEARLYKDGATTREITGLTVGTSGTQVVLTSTTIASGQPVDMTSVTWTVPSSF